VVLGFLCYFGVFRMVWWYASCVCVFSGLVGFGWYNTGFGGFWVLMCLWWWLLWLWCVFWGFVEFWLFGISGLVCWGMKVWVLLFV